MSPSERSAAERFVILNRFLGFGNPRASIWFIGLEEASRWCRDPSKSEANYERYEKRYFPFRPGEITDEAKRAGRTRTRVYDIMSKLVVALTSGGQPSRTTWREYRDSSLLQEDGQTFQGNLYPLGKDHLPIWPEYYHELFGLKSREAYMAEVENKRFPYLREKHRQYAPQLTVCFGKAGWKDFKKLFALGTDYEPAEQACIYPRGIVLCPFFGRMSDDYIVRLANSIREAVGLAFDDSAAEKIGSDTATR